MEMTFGNAHDIWRRVVSGDNSLTEEEVMIAAKWFEGFIPKLSDKASQSKQELEDAIQAQNAIEKKTFMDFNGQKKKLKDISEQQTYKGRQRLFSAARYTK